MSNKKTITTLTSVICAIAMVLQVSVLLAGNQQPGVNQQCVQTAATVKNVSAPSEALTPKYTVVKQIPVSNALDILAKTGTPADIKKPETILPVLSDQKALFDVTNVSTENAAASENSTGNPISSIKSFLALYEAGINNLNVYLVNVEGGLKEFMAEYDNNLGEHQTFKSNIYYDETKQLIYGKDDTGVFALGFDFDYGQMTIYSAKNSWQRNLGFCILYDVLSPIISFDYKTVRIKFDYNNMDWMLQLWKGRYIITMGAEVGLYFKPKDRAVEFYDCVDDANAMPMSLRLLKGSELLFEKEMQTCWWQTGFKLGELYLPFQLTLESTLVFPNETMRNCFTQAVDQLADDKIAYEIEGNSVSLVW